jgi:hypothetical protein
MEQVEYVSNERRKDERFLKFQVLPKTNNTQALQKAVDSGCLDSVVTQASFTHVKSSSQLSIK